MSQEEKTLPPSFSSFQAALSFRSFKVSTSPSAEDRLGHEPGASKRSRKADERREKSPADHRHRNDRKKRKVESTRKDASGSASHQSRSTETKSDKGGLTRSRDHASEDGRHRKSSHKLPDQGKTETSKRSQLVESHHDQGFARAPSDSVAGVFIKDTVGDLARAKYGPTKHSISRFRRSCGGRVLGLDQGLRIAPQLSDHRGVVIVPRGRAPLRYIDSSHAWKAHRRPRKRLRLATGPEADRTNFDHLSDFVAVSYGRPRRDSGSGQTLSPPRFLDNLGDEVTSESESDSLLSDVGADPGEELRRKVAHANAAVSSEPTNLQAWLKLVELQRDLATSPAMEEERGSDQVKRTSRKSKMGGKTLSLGVVEAQISVLDKALASVSDIDDQLRLQLERISIATVAGIWDVKAAEEQWERLLPIGAEHGAPASYAGLRWRSKVQGWHHYTSWKSRQASKWTFTKVLNAYGQALGALNEEVFALDPDSSGQLEQAMVDMQLELAAVMRSAGYVERGFAVLQAQSQLCATYLQDSRSTSLLTFNDALDKAEQQWDEEGPRFGEPLALCHADAPKQGNHDPLDQWLASEHARARAHRYPTRTTDAPLWDIGEAEVDPFSSIFFSDVSPFLCNLRTSQARNRLVDAFLQYLGLPSGSFSASPSICSTAVLSTWALLDRETQKNHFWPSALVSNQTDRLSHLSIELEPRRHPSRLENPFSNPHLTLPADELTDLPHRNAQALHFSQLGQAVIGSADVQQCRQVIKAAQTAWATPVSRLSILDFYLDLASSTTSINKVGKRALSTKGSQDADLWLAYANAEKVYGSLETARKTLRMTLSSLESSAIESAKLWYSLAELEHRPDPHVAVKLLCRAANLRFGRPSLDALYSLQNMPDPSPIEARKARNYYKHRFQESSEDVHLRMIALATGFLLEWLVTGSEYRAGVLEEYLDLLQGIETAAADMCRLRIWAIVWRSLQDQSDRSLKPAQARSLLIKTAQESSSTAFLALLAAHEMSRRFEGQLRLTLERDILPRVVQASDDPAQEQRKEAVFVFATFAEANLYPSHWNQHAVRRQLEVATAHLPHSLLLWHLYLDFEIFVLERVESLSSPASLKECRNRAKDVFFRALRACPGDKNIYLAAFAHPLKHALTGSELKTLAHTMEERELRLFVPIDDSWCEDERSQGEPIDEDDASDDAMEERKRLLPF